MWWIIGPIFTWHNYEKLSAPISKNYHFRSLITKFQSKWKMSSRKTKDNKWWRYFVCNDDAGFWSICWTIENISAEIQRCNYKIHVIINAYSLGSMFQYWKEIVFLSLSQWKVKREQWEQLVKDQNWKMKVEIFHIITVVRLCAQVKLTQFTGFNLNFFTVNIYWKSDDHISSITFLEVQCGFMGYEFSVYKCTSSYLQVLCIQRWSLQNKQMLYMVLRIPPR